MVRPNICITGDSIEANWPYSIGGSTYSYSLIEAVRFQMKIDFTDLAVASTHQTDALNYWNALSSGVQASFDFVIICGCHNDSGSGVASYVSVAQPLINQIAADKQASCKIILTTLTPASGTTPSDYIAINQAIRGQGASALTGFDYYIDEFSDYLEDPGNPGRLKSIYWGGVSGTDELHPNAAGREVYADAIVRKLKQLGVEV